mmetsp:Transcript_24567/g.78437  ORF Transcript_24567/g.78437 Transcript_24567/m.78437 type:complete len:241 (-) Transcript_24567:13-735(-)
MSSEIPQLFSAQIYNQCNQFNLSQTPSPAQCRPWTRQLAPARVTRRTSAQMPRPQRAHQRLISAHESVARTMSAIQRTAKPAAPVSRLQTTSSTPVRGTTTVENVTIGRVMPASTGAAAVSRVHVTCTSLRRAGATMLATPVLAGTNEATRVRDLKRRQTIRHPRPRIVAFGSRAVGRQLRCSSACWKQEPTSAMAGFGASFPAAGKRRLWTHANSESLCSSSLGTLSSPSRRSTRWSRS